MRQLGENSLILFSKEQVCSKSFFSGTTFGRILKKIYILQCLGLNSTLCDMSSFFSFIIYIRMLGSRSALSTLCLPYLNYITCQYISEVTFAPY